MKRTIVLMALIATLSNCGSPRPIQGTTSSESGSALGTAARRTNRLGSESTDNTAADTVMITGKQYIPILGKNEKGMRPDLEGSWVLESMPGASSERNNSAAPALNKNTPDAERHDSITKTETVNGVTRTTTTVNIERNGTQEKRITPPQGSNIHMPEKPSINFYGLNETFAGFTGCNKFSGRYTITGTNSISLQNAAASTKMVCIGDYDESAFLNTIRRVDKFKSTGNQLQLMEGDNVLLVFTKK